MWVAGLLVLGLAALEWTVAAWAERATGDDRVNQRIRNRVLNPIEVPVAGVLIIGARGVRRQPGAAGGAGEAVGLADDRLRRRWSSWWRSSWPPCPTWPGRSSASSSASASLAVLVGGIIGAANGERHFEEHETEHDRYDTTVTTLAGNPQTGVVTTTTTEGGG